MSFLTSLYRHRDRAHWRFLVAGIAVTVGCLTAISLGFAQEPAPGTKPAPAVEQVDAEPKVGTREQRLAENSRLLAEENKLAGEQKYADAIKTSQQRESVLLEIAMLPELKSAANMARLQLLATRGNWQWLNGEVTDAVKTSDERLRLAVAELGAGHWQTASIRFELDYFRRLAAIDKSTRDQMLQLEQQINAASSKGDHREAIAKQDALKDIEAKVLGIEHPFYANSLANIAFHCLQTHDYERTVRELQTTLAIRHKAYRNAHPDIIACQDGLAAVARQQRQWDVARSYYDRSSPVRRELFGTISPDDPAVWLDDFVKDSRQQYAAAGEFQWEKGHLTLKPGSSISRAVAAGRAWEAQLDLAFPPVRKGEEPATARFLFGMEGVPTIHAFVWKAESREGETFTRMQFVEITPQSESTVEKVKIIREIDLPHEPSGAWSLTWDYGLLQVQRCEQPVFEGYVNGDGECSAWALGTLSGCVEITRLSFQGVARRVFSAAETPQFRKVKMDYRSYEQLLQQDKFEEATKLGEQLQPAYLVVYSDDQDRTATFFNNLGLAYLQIANYAAAEPLLLQALKIKEKSLGTDHPRTAEVLNNLASLYSLQANDAAAEPLLLRTLRIYEKSLGPENPGTSVALNNLASLYQDQGNYAATEPLLMRSLKIREKSLGPDDPTTAKGLNNLAGLYVLQAKYSSAEPLLLRALEIDEKSLPPNHPDLAAPLLNLAVLYEDQGNYAAAEPLFQRALKIDELNSGPDHPHTAVSLNNLALFYVQVRNYAAAEPLMQRALKIDELNRGPDHPHTAKFLINLGRLHTLQANYAAAEPLLLRALEILEKSRRAGKPVTPDGLLELAQLRRDQGNYANAESLVQRSLEIHESARGPDHPNTANVLIEFARLHQAQGNYATAEPLLKRALRIYEKSFGPEHPSVANCLSDQARLQQDLGNYAVAETLFQRALAILEKTFAVENLEIAVNLNNLASLYVVQKNYAAAEILFPRFLKIFETSVGPNHPQYADGLNNLASLYQAQGNYAAAEPFFHRTLEIREKTLGPEHHETGKALNNLAGLYQDQDNYAAAAHLFQRALKISEKALGPNHRDTVNASSNLARSRWYGDQAEPIAALAQSALRITLQNLDVTASIQTEQEQFLMARSLAGDISFWLTVSGADLTLTPTVYNDVLAWKGLITSRQQGLRRVLKDDPLFSEFRNVTQQLSTAILNPPVPPSDPKALDAWKVREPELRRNWANRKTSLSDEHQRLEHELAGKSAAFRESLEQRRVQPADLVATLKRQVQPTALVDVLHYYYFGRKCKDETSEWRVVAFVVRGDQPVVRVELGSAVAIAEHVDIWRGRRIQPDGTIREARPGTGPETVDSARWLREHLWEPLLPHLQGIETVLVSPDGALAQLPWGALPGEKPGTYLLEERSIAVIPVPQMLPSLLSNERRPGLPESLLIVGNIEYGASSGPPQDLLAKRDAVGRQRDGKVMQFPKLAAAQNEMASIQQRYEEAVRKSKQRGTVDLLGDEKATESSFCEQATHHQWLHLITHGFFAPETVQSVLHPTNVEHETFRLLDKPRPLQGEHPGLLSGLAFAGANLAPETENDDGILTALDVVALDLNQVDMVVLSACETGLGEVAGGEGLLGLQRAFQMAGTRTVVSSLWKVDDDGTQALMAEFYKNAWERKLPKLEALRQAQLTMLRHYDIKVGSLRGTVGKLKSQPNSTPAPEDSARTPPYYWAAFVLSGDWR